VAVDSQDKRMSMMGLGAPVPSVFPDPDNSLSVYDRAQYLWLYAGLDISAMVVIVAASVYGNPTPVGSVSGNPTPTAGLLGNPTPTGTVEGV